MTQSFAPPRIHPSRWIVLTLVTALAALACAPAVFQGWRARSWLPTPAEVLESKLERGHKNSYRLAVTYTYLFNEKRYFGTRFGYSGGASWNSLANTYAVGRQVTCYVNPKDPAEVILRRDPGGLHRYLPGIFLLIAIASGCLSLRALAQQHRADSATLYSLELADQRDPDSRKAA